MIPYPGLNGSSQQDTHLEFIPILPMNLPSSSQRPFIKSAKLPENVVAFLNDFYINTNRYPTPSQKDELVAYIRRFPGFEDYTRERLATWFTTKRKGDGTTNKRGKKRETGADILYPSISPSSLSKLKILYAETPNASPSLLQIWATKLRAEFEDVTTWIEVQRAQSENPGPVQNPWQSNSHLPTPTTSNSPEGSSPGSPLVSVTSSHFPSNVVTVKGERVESPIIHQGPGPQFIQHLSQPHPNSNTYPPAQPNDIVRLPHVHAPAAPASVPDPSLTHMDVDPPQSAREPSSSSPSQPGQQLANTLQRMFAENPGLHSEPAQTPAPTNAREFNSMFARYADMLQDFLAKMESGNLRDLGFAPESQLTIKQTASGASQQFNTDSDVPLSELIRSTDTILSADAQRDRPP